MDNYDKARKVLQSMALSKIAQETGISIGQIWHYRDRYEGIQKAPPPSLAIDLDTIELLVLGAL